MIQIFKFQTISFEITLYMVFVMVGVKTLHFTFHKNIYLVFAMVVVVHVLQLSKLYQK